MASPSPAPPVSRVRPASTRKNRSKIRAWCPGSIPGPLSSTSTRMDSASPCTRTRTQPSRSVYFRALDTRLPRMCTPASRFKSAPVSSSDASSTRSIPRRCAGSRCCSTTSRARQETSALSRGKSPSRDSSLKRCCKSENMDPRRRVFRRIASSICTASPGRCSVSASRVSA